MTTISVAKIINKLFKMRLLLKFSATNCVHISFYLYYNFNIKGYKFDNNLTTRIKAV
jgi:hypothetical protein